MIRGAHQESQRRSSPTMHTWVQRLLVVLSIGLIGLLLFSGFVGVHWCYGNRGETIGFGLGLVWWTSEPLYAPEIPFEISRYSRPNIELLWEFRDGMVAMPLWIPSAVCVCATLVILRSKNAPVVYPGCPTCGYNLTGNTSGVCPECGKSVRPDQRQGR